MRIPFDHALVTQKQAARLTPAEDGSLIFSDGSVAGFQIVEWPHRDLARALLHLRLALRPIEGGEASFAVTEGPTREILRIGRDGTLLASREGAVLDQTCTRDEDGWLRLDIRFRNTPPSLGFGLPRTALRQAGSGTPQFALKDIEIDVIEPRWTPGPEDRLVLLDAPGQPRIEPGWAPYVAGLRAIICEPDAALGAAALAALPPEGEHILLPRVLSNRTGAGKFHTARAPAMSSTLEPDQRRLKPFLAAPSYEVTATQKVEMVRYDTVSKQLGLPQPDLIRLAAGGAEFEVLRGCGGVLDQVLGVTVQAHLYPLYRRQKLLGDIVDLLDSYGLALRRILPRTPAQYDHELAVVTAYLTRRATTRERQGKLDFIEEVWGISRGS